MDHQTFAQLLGNYGEFVGAIAVVVTLAYLAVQVRQSKQTSIQAIMLARAEAGRDMGLRLSDSNHIPGILCKIRAVDGVAGADEQEFMSRYDLTEEEAYRWLNHLFAQLRLMEIRFIHSLASDLESERTRLEGFVQARTFAIWWPVHRNSFDKTFRDEVDSAFASLK